MNSIQQATKLMNTYGQSAIPFIFIIDFLQENPRVYRIDQISSKFILYNLQGFKNYTHSQKLSKIPYLKKFPRSFQVYEKAFNLVKEHLLFGNSYLVNLAQPTPIETNLGLKEIFFQASTPYKLWIHEQFVCFSPEIFVQIQEGLIYSYPMKGTIDATIPQAREILLNNPKELAEHRTIVDLIRNDLNQISKKVRVEKFRYVDEVLTNQKNLLQVSSQIVGELPPDYPRRIGEIIFQLLPAGSISGAPKKKTLEIIQAAEPYPRGDYTGIFGYFDGKNLNSGVMIRFIEKIDHQLYFKSGGGITALSKVEEEYQELIDKVYLPIPTKVGSPIERI